MNGLHVGSHRFQFKALNNEKKKEKPTGNKNATGKVNSMTANGKTLITLM